MTEPSADHALLLAIAGGVVVASLLIRAGARRLGLPAMAGYTLLGVGLSGLDAAWGFLGEPLRGHLDVLAQIGVVTLLFKVGLESDLDQLAKQLGAAALIWLPNMIVPGLVVFAAVALVLDFGLLPGLFAGVAASATSVGVSAAVWEDAGRLQTPEGALLVDVAELDDLSAVILMSLLFVTAPMLMEGKAGQALGPVLWTTAAQLGKLVVFAGGCYLFSRYGERPLTAWFGRRDQRHGALVFATGAALLIAATADAIGFSLAIGALFAGLAFSRDPAERRIDRAFGGLFALFSPFFFVMIGLAVTPAAVGGALGVGAVLFAAAALGKILGAGLPAALLTTRRTGLLIGLSLVPRAEIFLIVMVHGLLLGAPAVPEALYAGAVLASVLSCIAAPVGVRALLATPHRGKRPA